MLLTVFRWFSSAKDLSKEKLIQVHISLLEKSPNVTLAISQAKLELEIVPEQILKSAEKQLFF